MTWQVLEPILSPLSDDLKAQITLFYELLVTENKKYNLTRITDWNELLNKHFLDSLLFTKEITLNNQKILDIGSGAGFPGIVLKLFYPNLEVTLIEANQKKAKFLEMVIKNLNLTGIQVIQERAENYALNHREQFEVVVSRALAPLRIFLELGAPFLKENGLLVALKGPRADEEKELIGGLEDKLGLIYLREQVGDHTYGQRKNLFYQKVKKSPSIYPRPYRVIKKEFDNLRKK